MGESNCLGFCLSREVNEKLDAKDMEIVDRKVSWCFAVRRIILERGFSDVKLVKAIEKLKGFILEGIDCDDNRLLYNKLVDLVDKGYAAAVRLLLGDEIIHRLITEDHDGGLSGAVYRGHEAVVRVLLSDRRIYLLIPQNIVSLTFRNVVQNGHEVVLRLLLGNDRIRELITADTVRIALVGSANENIKQVIYQFYPDSRPRRFSCYFNDGAKKVFLLRH